MASSQDFAEIISVLKNWRDRRLRVSIKFWQSGQTYMNLRAKGRVGSADEAELTLVLDLDPSATGSLTFSFNASAGARLISTSEFEFDEDGLLTSEYFESMILLKFFPHNDWCRLAALKENVAA